MFRSLTLIGIGSFIGGICRFLLQQFAQKHYPATIPLGTLTVNLIGCFFIGIIYQLAARGNVVSIEMRLFLATGLCGGFTTFSAFASEKVLMVLDGNLNNAIFYTFLSVVTGFGAVHAGIILIKLIF